jgi:hypothetical protein|tara:strand:- start:3408 stop:3968 length:561 start_codon:yes stop_codon:yes gene_type:complete
MKSPFNFIVKAYNERRYDNIKQIGDIDFVTSVSKEDHTASNRFAIVEELPINYTGPIKKGDTLLVHHNVFKFYFDMKGREKSGRSFFKDDLFFVDPYQFFMYKQNGKWHAHGKYCFVKPIKAKDSFIKKSGEEPLTGVMRYVNKDLIELGVKEGDEISFQPDSEYEFNVEGEKLYRMYTENITLVL